jgi:hypothetical protein
VPLRWGILLSAASSLLIRTLRVVKARARDMLAVWFGEGESEAMTVITRGTESYQTRDRRQSTLDLRNVTSLSACLTSVGGGCGDVVNVLHPMLKAEGSYRGAQMGGFPLSRIWR